MRTKTTMTFLSILAMVAIGATAEAQGFRWPEEPENLKVLPESVKGAELGGLMRSFATGLGVRCQFCHVAREAQTLDPMDLTTFDFASDANPMKDKARLMLRMVQSIGESYLDKLDVPAAERVEVSCVTCHRGVSKPLLLQDVLAEVIEEKGVEASVARYHELREEHYGGFAYNFRPGVLTQLGERLLDQDEIEQAIEILELENEQHSGFAYGHFVRGNAHEKAGEREAAVAHFAIAVELAPEGQKAFFQRALDRLK